MEITIKNIALAIHGLFWLTYLHCRLYLLSRSIILSNYIWACGAVGSALPSHGRGHEFDSYLVQLIFFKYNANR